MKIARFPHVIVGRAWYRANPRLYREREARYRAASDGRVVRYRETTRYRAPAQDNAHSRKVLCGAEEAPTGPPPKKQERLKVKLELNGQGSRSATKAKTIL